MASVEEVDAMNGLNPRRGLPGSVRRVLAAAMTALMIGCDGGTAPAVPAALAVPLADGIDGPGPPLSVSSADIGDALRCTPAALDTGRPVVLLVHGTGLTADESWDGNYGTILPTLGYPVCALDLPQRALGDIQTAAEVVVGALRRISGGSGRRVNVLSHSQGALEVRWALRYWPDIAGRIDDFVMMAASNHGAIAANALCLQTVLACTPAIQQQRPGSALLAALNADEGVPDGVSATSLYSLSDEIVTNLPPNYASALAGATNLLIQQVCPLRVVTHLQFLTSGAAFALVLDAFDHPGPADPARLDLAAACLSLSAPGVRLNDYLRTNGASYLAALLSVASGRGAPEPPLADYVSDAAP